MKSLYLGILLATYSAASTASNTLKPPVIDLDVSGLNVAVSYEWVEGADYYNLYYAPYPFKGNSTIHKLPEPYQKTHSFVKSYELWEGASYYIAVKSAKMVNGVEVESELSNPVLFRDLKPLEYFPQRPDIIPPTLRSKWSCPSEWHGVPWFSADRFDYDQNPKPYGVQFLDLNNDDWDDFIVNTFCWNVEGVNDVWVPSASTFMVYVSDAEGNYSIQTEKYFGSSVPFLDNTGSPIIRDFNNDGVDDLFFTPGHEDRNWANGPSNSRELNGNCSWCGYDNWASHATVYMSNKEGTYTLDRLDHLRLYNTDSQAVVPNRYGTTDIVMGGGMVIRYLNNEWLDVTEEYRAGKKEDEDIWGGWGRLNINDRYVLTGNMVDNKSGISLAKFDGTDWTIIDDIRDPQIGLEQYQGQRFGLHHGDSEDNTITDYVYRYNDEYKSGHVMRNAFCEIPDYNNTNNTLYLIMYHTTLIKDGKKEPVEHIGLHGVMIENEKLVYVDDLLIEADDHIKSGWMISCDDFNEDGNVDLYWSTRTRYPYWIEGGKGILYLQDENGSFVDTRITHGNILPYSKFEQHVFSFPRDINNDGIMDLFYVRHGNEWTVRDRDFEIYLGIKPIGD